MMKTMLKTMMSHLGRALLLVAGVALAGQVRADTVYRTVWYQDFSDASTYTSQLNGNAYVNAVFGITADSTSATAGGTISQAERTPYGTYRSEKFLSAFISTSGNINTTFMMPDAATSATDYKIEFDTFISAPTTSTMSGLAIQGANGPIATIYAGVGNKSSETDVYVYNQADSTLQLATYKTGTRGINPASYPKYWIHVTVEGVSDSGIYLEITRADGTAVLTKTLVSSTFDVVEALFLRWTSSNSYDRYAALDNVAVSTPASAAAYTWTGAAGDSLWSNAENWLVGEDVATGEPTSLDTVTIPDNSGDILVTSDWSYSTITLGSDSRIAIIGTTDATETEILTVPDTFTTDNVIVYGPYDYSVESGSVKATRVPSTFTCVSDGDFNSPLIWNVSGYETWVYPAKEDDVLFPSKDSGYSITLGSDCNCSNVTMNADVSLTGSKAILCRGNISGTGTLTLDGVCLRGTGMAGKNMYIYVDVEVESGKTAYIQNTGANNDTQSDIYISGNIIGEGTLQVEPSNKRYKGGVHFTSTEPTFNGTVIFNKSSYSENYTYHEVASANVFSNATLEVNVDFSSRYSSPYIFRNLENSNIYVGAINGKLYARGANSGDGLKEWINSGFLDKDGTLTGDLALARADSKVVSTAGMGFRWVAPTATMNYSVAKTAYEEITGGGVFKIVSTNGLAWSRLSFLDNGGVLKTGYDLVDDVAVPVDPSAIISNSTVAIQFDDEGTNRTWTAALAASNTGGFTKLGSGTLTLKEAPLYSGQTRVKEGALLVPTGSTMTLSSGVKQDGTVEVDGVTYDKYIGYEVASVTVGEVTTTFSNVEDAARFAMTNGNATVNIIAEFEGTETVVVLPGETLTFTISDENNYSSGKLYVVGADGATVEAVNGNYTYTCPKLWMLTDLLTGDETASESYFTTADLYVPKNVNSAQGSLTVTGSSTDFTVNGTANVAYSNYSIGELNIENNATMSITNILRVGNNAGTGTVHVVSGTLDVGNQLYVGDGASKGTMEVTGGTVNVAGEGRIGAGGNSKSELTIKGGAVKFNSSSANTSIGYGSNSKATLNVYGGTLDVPNKDLVISANNVTSSGFFDFASGTVNLGKGLKIGGKDGSTTSRGYASGVISNTVVVGMNELKVGNAKYSDAELLIAGGTTTVTNVIDIAANNCVSGTVYMTSGTITAGGNSMALNAGRGESSYGYFYMTGGTLTFGSKGGINVGYGSASTGTVEIVGGVVDITKNGDGYINMPCDSAKPTESSPMGSILVIGDTACVTTKLVNVGSNTNSWANLSVTGGVLVAKSCLRIGGKYKNGTLDETAIGSFVQTDGEVIAEDTCIFGAGGATGTATLSGGTLSVKAITLGTGTGSITFNGGTLKALAASDNFIGVPVTLEDGGMIIDTDGYAVTITNAIDTTDGTITKKGSGTLTFTNGDNIDVSKITVEDGGVVVVKTTGTTYLGECSISGEYRINGASDEVRNGSLAASGLMYVGSEDNTTAQLDITNATVSALRVNLAKANSTSTTLNIWAGGKLVTTGIPGTDQYAEYMYVGYGSGENTVNVKGGAIDTAAMINLRSGTASSAINVTEGGIITVAGITGSSGQVVTFDGGTLAAKVATNEFVTTIGVTVGTNGMTISNDVAITASSALSGTGGLTKKGSGVLTLTTAPTFSGTITVAENGGSVVVPNTCTVAPGTNTVRSFGTNNTYVFTYSASSDALEPGQTDGNTYDTLTDAKTAAAAITEIGIPAAVSSVVTNEAQIAAYKALFSAQAVETTEGKYVVVVDFTDSAKSNLESTLTLEFADVDFTSIATTGASVTIESPIAGLYYGVLTGTGPTGLTLSDTPTLSDGSSLNLTLPSGDGVQFYKLQVSTTSN